MRSIKEQVLAGQLTTDWHILLDVLESTPKVPGILGRSAQSELSTSVDDPQLGSLAAAIDTGFHGWSEGATTARQHDKYGAYFGMAEQRQVTWGYSDEEGEFQTDRFLNGSADYLLTFKTKRRFSQGLRIVVSTGASSAIASTTLNYSATVVAAHIAKLEILRIPFELWSVDPCTHGSGLDMSHWYALRLHSSGDVFNLARIVYFCGHAAIQRRLMFAMYERMSVENQRRFGLLYGYPAAITAKTFPLLNLPPWHGQTVVIGNVQTNNQEMVEQRIVKAFRTGYDKINKMAPVGGVVIL